MGLIEIARNRALASQAAFEARGMLSGSAMLMRWRIRS
jgi:hypothetical protein